MIGREALEFRIHKTAALNMHWWLGYVRQASFSKYIQGAAKK